MARCEDCIHGECCRIYIPVRTILCGDKADERCKWFKSTADVVPKSEVERLNKELDELAEELSDLIVEKDQLFDIAEKQKVELEALKIANEKMYSANKEQEAEIERLEYDKKIVFDEGESWHRTADSYAKRMCELDAELKAMRCAANSYKMHYENLAREICCAIEEEIVAALECNYKRRTEYYTKERYKKEDGEFINNVNGKIDALRGIEGFVEELKKKYIPKDCRDCRYFVGCECFSGMTCNMYEEKKT